MAKSPKGEPLVGDVKLVAISEGAANELEIIRLRLRRQDKVFRLRRIRLSNGRPFVSEEASVPAVLFPGLEKRKSITHCIVSLCGNYGILLGKAEERISVRAASVDIAQALNIPEGSPVAAMDRVVRAIDERPVEWRTAWCELRDNHYLSSMG